MSKKVVVKSKGKYKLKQTDDIIYDLEALLKTLELLTFKDMADIQLGKSFTVQMIKRQTSSRHAKRKAYAYTGAIYFNYNEHRKNIRLPLLSRNDRSYKNFTKQNFRYILQRAIQHFQLDKNELITSDKLACWLK